MNTELRNQLVDKNINAKSFGGAMAQATYYVEIHCDGTRAMAPVTSMEEALRIAKVVIDEGGTATIGKINHMETQK